MGNWQERIGIDPSRCCVYYAVAMNNRRTPVYHPRTLETACRAAARQFPVDGPARPPVRFKPLAQIVSNTHEAALPGLHLDSLNLDRAVLAVNF
jgi:hypothetical protein